MGGSLPVHGFVLAGGQSSRMGQDKALLRLGGRPLVELAVEKLSGVCEVVSIAGNRDDLAGFAGVVRERRMDAGPGAGVEAGLLVAEREWGLFVPVDVPLLPAALLRVWAEEVLGSGCSASYMTADGVLQPTVCMVRRECAQGMGLALDGGERRLRVLLESAGQVMVWEAGKSGSKAEVERWFRNVNTPEEFAAIELQVGVQGRVMAE